MNRPRRFGLFALSVLFAIRAAAHPAPNSVVNLDFGRSSVHAELLLPTSELRYALAAEGIERSSISPGDPAISDYLARHVGLATLPAAVGIALCVQAICRSSGGTNILSRHWTSHLRRARRHGSSFFRPIRSRMRCAITT